MLHCLFVCQSSTHSQQLICVDAGFYFNFFFFLWEGRGSVSGSLFFFFVVVFFFFLGGGGDFLF